MGNRAVICFDKYTPKKNQISLYLHWNGGRDSVDAFLKATRIVMDSRGEDSSYAKARLVQVIGTFLVGNMSFGLYEKASDPGDNGIYVVDSKTLQIIDRPGFEYDEEEGEYDLNEFVNEIIKRLNAVYMVANEDNSFPEALLPTAEEYDAQNAPKETPEEAFKRAQLIVAKSFANLHS